MLVYILLLLFSGIINGCGVSNLSCEDFDIQNNCKSHSIFVPRQLSYNPIYENALTFDRSISCQDWDYIFALKPVYTQSVGCKFKRYFNIGHQPVMTVREGGSGDIDPLWLQVISSDSTFYSSDLSFCPVRKTFGALVYFEMQLPCNFLFSLNTAIVRASNNMRLIERNVQNLGTADYLTVAESLASPLRLFGKVQCKRHKSGVDDIQLKFIRQLCDRECWMWDIYGLVGIPTGSGSKAEYLFEPLVGSKHAQLGLGTNFARDLRYYDCGSISFQGEIKWRYGLKGSEYRSFDLTNNGEWSRYMLFVNSANKFVTEFAINNLTFKSQVTPRNSLDVYLALHANRNKWQFEFGYDFWYRSQEKIVVGDCENSLKNLGIADLLGIAQEVPQSASSANISQTVADGKNQMVSDASFVAVGLQDLNLNSGAQPKNMSNSIYASIGYLGNYGCHPVEVGLSGSYERGSNINTPDNFSIWADLEVSF